MEVFPPLPTDNFQRPWVTNPAHICIASYELLGPSRNGGIGTAYSALASALTEAGHQVTLLYLFGDWYDNGTVSEWRTHYHSKGIEFCPLPASAHSPEGPQSLNISLEAYRWLKTRDFDIIHFPELLGHGFFRRLASSSSSILIRSSAASASAYASRGRGYFLFVATSMTRI